MLFALSDDAWVTIAGMVLAQVSTLVVMYLKMNAVKHEVETKAAETKEEVKKVQQEVNGRMQELMILHTQAAKQQGKEAGKAEARAEDAVARDALKAVVKEVVPPKPPESPP